MESRQQSFADDDGHKLELIFKYLVLAIEGLESLLVLEHGGRVFLECLPRELHRVGHLLCSVSGTAQCIRHANFAELQFLQDRSQTLSGFADACKAANEQGNSVSCVILKRLFEIR